MWSLGFHHWVLSQFYRLRGDACLGRTEYYADLAYEGPALVRACVIGGVSIVQIAVSVMFYMYYLFGVWGMEAIVLLCRVDDCTYRILGLGLEGVSTTSTCYTSPCIEPCLFPLGCVIKLAQEISSIHLNWLNIPSYMLRGQWIDLWREGDLWLLDLSNNPGFWHCHGAIDQSLTLLRTIIRGWELERKMLANNTSDDDQSNYWCPYLNMGRDITGRVLW